MLHNSRTRGHARFGLAGPAAILAAVLLFAACADTPTSPVQAGAAGANLSGAGIGIASAGTADADGTDAPAAAHSEEGSDESDRDRHDDNVQLRDLFLIGSPFTEGNVVGSSRVKQDDNELEVDIQTELFEMPAAVTVWAIIFNTPGGCTAGEPGLMCGVGDIGNAAANPSAIWAAGKVLGTDDDEDRIEFKLVEGAPAGQVLFGPGLTDAAGSEVHFIVRSHGPPDPNRDLLELQLSTVSGGCTSGLPDGSVPSNPGECADVAVSVPLPRL